MSRIKPVLLRTYFLICFLLTVAFTISLVVQFNEYRNGSRKFEKASNALNNFPAEGIVRLEKPWLKEGTKSFEEKVGTLRYEYFCAQWEMGLIELQSPTGCDGNYSAEFVSYLKKQDVAPYDISYSKYRKNYKWEIPILFLGMLVFFLCITHALQWILTGSALWIFKKS